MYVDLFYFLFEIYSSASFAFFFPNMSRTVFQLNITDIHTPMKTDLDILCIKVGGASSSHINENRKSIVNQYTLQAKKLIINRCTPDLLSYHVLNPIPLI